MNGQDLSYTQSPEHFWLMSLSGFQMENSRWWRFIPIANGQILNHSQKIEALKENYSNEIIELKKKIAEFEKNEVHRYTTVPQLIITNIKDILAQVMHIQELRKTQEKLHQMQSEIESYFASKNASTLFSAHTHTFLYFLAT